MIFIETSAFTRELHRQAKGACDEVLQAIQKDLLDNPERGDIVAGLGGVRKARSADPARGKGKRGGYRYLFLYVELLSHTYLVYLYGKGEKGDITPEEKNFLRALIGQIKGAR